MYAKYSVQEQLTKSSLSWCESSFM